MRANPAATTTILARSPSTPALREALEHALGGDRRIVRLERRPSPYTSSYQLEELTVYFADAARLELVFKAYGRAALTAEGRLAKPADLLDPERPLEIYRTILADGALGTPRCFGVVSNPAAGRYWLFLERVSGLRLSHVGDFNVWCLAASWLARFHARFPAYAPEVARLERLLSQDPASWRRWMRRTLARAREGRLPASVRGGLIRLATHHERVVERLAAIPCAILHGEFCSDNILVQGHGPGARICPVDWEMAARGPALIDVAALVAGGWSEDQGRALALAYRDALPVPRPPVEQFLQDLDYCRLQWAIQWVGWFDRYRPPPGQDHDWPQEALALADRLGL